MDPTLSAVCQLFTRLSAIPHPSGGEGAITAFIAKMLSDLGLMSQMDQAHNLRCILPATPGMEDVPGIILQAHTDMVCVAAPGSRWNPAHDAVKVVNDGEYLRSDGRSTLGADNGIGVAVMLHLAQRTDLVHGEIQLLFTACEERGLLGAAALDPKWLEGFQYYINLDAFRSDAAIFASAGGLRQSWMQPIQRTPTVRPCAFHVILSGLIGGHSGFDIHRGRGNAISLLAKVLYDWGGAVANFSGGDNYNAIPTYAQALVCTTDLDSFFDYIQHTEQALREEFGDSEPELSLVAVPCAPPLLCWIEDFRKDVLSFLMNLPQGALEWRTDCTSTVAKSGNPAVITEVGNMLEVRHFARCATDAYMDEIAASTAADAKKFHFTQNQVSRYAPWDGKDTDPFLARVQQCYHSITGHEMEATAVHVGLEASRILEKAPHLSGVSLGAEISDAHSVSERVTLESISTLTQLIIKLVTVPSEEDDA